MATSSIFADFSIKDKKTAKAFVEALEASAQEPRRRRTNSSCRVLTDSEEIKKRFAKLIQRKG